MQPLDLVTSIREIQKCIERGNQFINFQHIAVRKRVIFIVPGMQFEGTSFASGILLNGRRCYRKVVAIETSVL